MGKEMDTSGAWGGITDTELSMEERSFITENHHMVKEYLQMRRLPEDEWYDVVIFRFIRAVQLWFSRPDLHRWAFRTIAYQNMRSAIGHEMEKQRRRIHAASLDAEIPGTDGLTIADTVTDENRNFINYVFQKGRSDDGMQLHYNVKLPPKKETKHGQKSDERIAIEAFMQSTHKNMCFEYDTSMEAKKKLSTINAARRSKNETDIYDTYRIDKCVYIVRQEKKKGK